MTSSEITEICELLKADRKAVVVSHANPDGDAVGSVLAIYGFLIKNGLQASAVLPDSLPSFYKWMVNSDKIIAADQHMEKAKEVMKEADIIFCLDFNAAKRIGELEKPLINARGIKVLVDHHPEPEEGFDYVISDISVSSTAELVYRLINALGGKAQIDKHMAEAIYTGIMTDTGSFNFNSANPDMYEVLKYLVELGVDPALMHQRVYDTFSESRIRLIGHSLLNKMVVIPEAKTAYIALTKKELEEFKHEKGDTEGLVNYPLGMDGIVFAALFTEKDEMIKASFRSKGEFKANEVARNYFRGGGHKNAAGGKSYQSMKKTIDKFESLVKNEFLKQLNDANEEA